MDLKYKELGTIKDRSGRYRTGVSYTCPICLKEIIIRKESAFLNKSGCCKNCKNYLRKGTSSPQWKGYGNMPYSCYGRVIRGAKSRQIPVEISIEDLDTQWVKQDGKCYFTGMPLALDALARKDKSTASLDRLDSALAYTKDNIVWVHKTINKMKQDLTPDIFIEFCKLVAAY